MEGLIVAPLPLGVSEESMELDHASNSTSYPTSPHREAQQCTDHSPTNYRRAQYTDVIKDLLLYTTKKPMSVEEMVTSSLSTVKMYDVKEPIGCAMLLGSETVNNQKHLPSVCVDLDVMSTTLKNGGWHIIEHSSGLRRRTLLNLLDNLRRNEANLAQFSVFILYYSGHGVAEGVFLTDGEVVCYSDIVTSVSSIPSLKEKPKIFIFDCCRRSSLKELPNNNSSNNLPSVVPKHRFSENRFQFREDLMTEHERCTSTDTYPPRHTMICFSATEGCVSYMDRYEGSFYTLTLCHAIKQLGGTLSLHEIITQAGGGTHEVACHHNIIQHPIIISNLEKQLVLNTNFCADIEKDYVERSPVMALQETQYPSLQVMVINKGLKSGGEIGERCKTGERLERDNIPKEPVKLTKEDIVRNVNSLGDGISIFFIYAPNPDDPYKKPSASDRLELKNKYLMSRLFFDLELHGFHVLSDLHLGNNEPSNWVLWYISRIQRCKFVVFVCSPAFKELFQEESPTPEKIVNVKARRLLDYRNAVYSEISNELGKEGRKKFIPVVLNDSYDNKDCVPLLFQPGTVYRVVPEDKRLFDYDDRSRDFERLVCHMTGINRVELDKESQVDEVPIVRELFRGDAVEKDSRLLSGPPQGYVGPDYQRSRGLVGSSQSTTTTGVLDQHGTLMGAPGGLHHINVVQPILQQQQPYLPLQQNPHHHPYPPQQNPYHHHPYPPQQNPYHHHPHPQHPYPPQQNSHHQQPYPPPQQNPHHHHPYPLPQQNPHHQQPYPLPQQNPHHQQPPQQSQQQQQSMDDFSSLPSTPPDNRIFLWLSDEIISWKFFARHLGLPDKNIEKIEYDYHREGLTEHRYQMFTTWERLYYDECTYRKLGEVIKNSKENSHLYVEYVRRVSNLQQ